MLVLTIDEPDALVKAAHALSSEIRVNIIRLCGKSTAANIGGINLFGKQFGDYDQDIVMRVIYS